MKDINHELSKSLYDLYFSEEPDFEHSKKGATWKKHKYIRKENGKYIYPKGTSGLNNKRQNAHRYGWKNEYANELGQHNYKSIELPLAMGKANVYTQQDGTVVVLIPGNGKYTLPPGTNVSTVETRIKNFANQASIIDDQDMSSYIKNERARLTGTGYDFDTYDWSSVLTGAGNYHLDTPKDTRYTQYSINRGEKPISERPDDWEMSEVEKNRRNDHEREHGKSENQASNEILDNLENKMRDVELLGVRKSKDKTMSNNIKDAMRRSIGGSVRSELSKRKKK